MAKARTRSKSPTSDLVWDYRDEVVPRVGTPSADAIAKRQRRMRRYVRSSAILLPFVLVVSLLVVMSGIKGHVAQHSVGGSASSSPGRTAATLALDEWLAEVPSPLPGAQILSWDGATHLAPASASTPNNVTWNAELDSFTLIVGRVTSPTIYRATIEVALRKSGGAVALGGPSLTVEPRTGTTSGWDAGGPWSGISSQNSVTASVQSAIDGWLSAYTSGSPSRLRLAVGDTKSDGFYVPLSGVTSATNNVIAAAPRLAPNQAPTPTSQNISAEIVEVSLDLIWPHEKSPSNGGTYATGPSTTMDLLLENANTAAPVVVAWGPPGSGPHLVPYQNVQHG